jgi:hypothetical protein
MLARSMKNPKAGVRLGALLAFCLASALAGAGCAGQEQPANAPAGAGFPPWDEHARQVFDDNIDPEAVGLSMERGTSARADPRLRERAQTADVVARVKVQTVTVDSAGDQHTYHLGILVGTPPLADPKVKEKNFELSIKPSSSAFGIARSLDAGLRGRTFVAFLRRYTGDDGDMALHWHLAADTADVAAAVKEAVALGEAAGK